LSEKVNDQARQQLQLNPIVKAKTNAPRHSIIVANMEPIQEQHDNETSESSERFYDYAQPNINVNRPTIVEIKSNSKKSVNNYIAKQDPSIEILNIDSL